MQMTPAEKNAFEKIEQPYVLKFRKTSDWNVFNLKLGEWCEKMDSKYNPVQFATGTRTHCDTPYWEKFHGLENLTFVEFAKKMKADKSQNKWYSYNGSNIQKWPDDFVVNQQKDEIGFWLGSKRAHMPCHYNTSGLESIVQIYGHSFWLLFPPSTPFKPTRIPYSSSKVFSKENFYSPINAKQFGDIGKHGEAHQVILSPGNQLLIPPNWWKYGEYLCTSLSIDYRMSLPHLGDMSHLENLFVKQNVHCYMNYIELQRGRSLYTQLELGRIDGVYKTNETIASLKKEALQLINDSKKRKSRKRKDQEGCDTMLNSAKPAQPISYAAFTNILKLHSRRYDQSHNDRKLLDEKYKDIVHVINAACDQRAITSAAQIYLKQVKKYKTNIINIAEVGGNKNDKEGERSTAN